MQRELGRMIHELHLQELGNWEADCSLRSLLELFCDAVKSLGALAEAAYTLGYSDMSLIYGIGRTDLSGPQRRELLSKLLDQIEESLTLLSLQQWFVDYKRVVDDVFEGMDPQSAKYRVENFRQRLLKDLKSYVA